MKKFLIDFIPLAAFFLAYQFAPAEEGKTIFASFILTIATVVSMLLARLLKVRMDKFAIYSNVAVILFGFLTVFFENPNFIKAKLTVVNSVFGLILIGFYFFKKPFIKVLFSGKIDMDDDKWLSLTFRIAMMFFLIAVLNIFVWKFASEALWVKFKVFGVLLIMLVFFFSQAVFLSKYGRVPQK